MNRVVAQMSLQLARSARPVTIAEVGLSYRLSARKDTFVRKAPKLVRNSPALPARSTV